MQQEKPPIKIGGRELNSQIYDDLVAFGIDTYCIATTSRPESGHKPVRLVYSGVQALPY